MKQPDFAGASLYALERLERELPSHLVYHSVGHTRDEIIPAIERIASIEGVDGDLLHMLRTAAAFHDLGFIETYVGHESAGIAMARAVLPEHGFSQAQIETIASIIQSTKLPQMPHSLLEQIMDDADLDVFGRDDFMRRNNDLRRELEAIGRPSTDLEWYSSQYQFMSSHSYFTAAARRLRDEQKQRNLALLADRLKASRNALG